VGPTEFLDDLTLIAADDHFLNVIAADHGDVFDQPMSSASGFKAGILAPLLATWRAGIVDPMSPEIPTAHVIAQVARAGGGLTAIPSRRVLRPMIAVAVAISALLFGSAAVGAQSAKPGDTLWPLTQMLYTHHATSVVAGMAAAGSLDAARLALDAGDSPAALSALSLASWDMQRVSAADGLPQLQQHYSSLLRQANLSVLADDAASRTQASTAVASASGAQGRPGLGGTLTAVHPPTAAVAAAASARPTVTGLSVLRALPTLLSAPIRPTGSAGATGSAQPTTGTAPVLLPPGTSSSVGSTAPPTSVTTTGATTLGSTAPATADPGSATTSPDPGTAASGGTSTSAATGVTSSTAVTTTQSFAAAPTQDGSR